MNISKAELVERLRAAKPHCNHHANAGLCHQAADFIEQSISPVGEALLAECAKQFRFYEEHHRAKGTSESYEKSKVNGEFAHRIECYLQSRLDYASALPAPDHGVRERELEAALEPFAQYADALAKHLDADVPDERAVVAGPSHEWEAKLLAGDFRRARDVLASLSKDTGS